MISTGIGFGYIFIYNCEIFSPLISGFTLSLSQLFGRVGSGYADYLINYAKAINLHPYALIGLINIPLLVIVIFMPETKPRAVQSNI